MATATEFSTAANGGQPGLTVESFDNADLSGSPVSTRIERHLSMGKPFDLASLSSGETELDFSGFGAPKPLSTRWTGYYVPPTPGSYDVFVQQGGFDDCGFRLYVDGKLIEDHWQYFISPVEQFSLSLDASPHKFILEHHGTSLFGGPLLNGHRTLGRLDRGQRRRNSKESGRCRAGRGLRSRHGD